MQNPPKSFYIKLTLLEKLPLCNLELLFMSSTDQYRRYKSIHNVSNIQNYLIPFLDNLDHSLISILHQSHRPNTAKHIKVMTNWRIRIAYS